MQNYTFTLQIREMCSYTLQFTEQTSQIMIVINYLLNIYFMPCFYCKSLYGKHSLSLSKNVCCHSKWVQFKGNIRTQTRQTSKNGGQHKL